MNVSIKEDESLIKALRELYRRYGYRSFRMSKFEKYEFYARNKDFLVSDRVITFSDTNGDLLALKPDVTLSIVRSASFAPGRKQKLYYHENVYRPSGSENRFREIMQCGLECIGDLDSYDVSEVIHLAEESLCTVSDSCILSVSHLGILKCLLQAIHADQDDEDEILRLIASRNEHELTRLFEVRGWNGSLLRDLSSLLAISCSLCELPAALHVLNAEWISKEVLCELKELSVLAAGEKSIARFDLSVINDTHYYNGVVFQGFVRGVSEKVLSGGRYDMLLRRMDRNGGAIGFAVYLGLLEQLWTVPEDTDADVLVLYDDETPLTLLRDTIRTLQQKGRSVSAQRSESAGRFHETLDIRGGTEYA